MLKKEIKALFPKSKIDQFDPYFSECFEYSEINTKLRLAMFLSQVGVESAYFKTLSENLNYSEKRLSQVWPNRFLDKKTGTPNLLAKSIAGKPELIGNIVYSNRLGNNESNGFFFRGRGLIQLTGYFNYKAFSDDMSSYLGVNFLEHPDALLEPRNALYSACWFWRARNLNKFADKGDVVGATKIINGGNHGLTARTDLYNKILKVI